MAISQKLHTKLVQKLILTPSLQQAIKLLPMSTLELSELLNQEMVENPMLEEVPTEELQPVEAAQEKAEEKPAEKKDTWDDQDYEYFFGDYLDDGYRPRTPTEVKELPPIENTLSTAASLSDHLLWQLSMQTDEPLMREIGEAIIGNLDDDGYLVATVEELSGMGPWPTEEVERTLRLLQGFDPIGVEALQQPQRALHFLRWPRPHARQLFDRRHEIAVVIEVADDRFADLAHQRLVGLHRELPEQMVGQGGGGGEGVFDRRKLFHLRRRARSVAVVKVIAEEVL